MIEGLLMSRREFIGAAACLLVEMPEPVETSRLVCVVVWDHTHRKWIGVWRRR